MATQVPFDFVRDWRGDLNIGKQCEVLIEDRIGSGYPLHFLWDAASEALSYHRWDTLESIFYEGIIAEICNRFRGCGGVGEARLYTCSSKL
ncbi:hypothetical protein SUNI508_09569 [Seiridium unicorne]|uniref:Uncharacterized protein n=1 Tax=Seiridium unicorne TaxID=138068 RepID=A0ABR2UPV0_9PEZI